jgi:hypothetical protein
MNFCPETYAEWPLLLPVLLHSSENPCSVYGPSLDRSSAWKQKGELADA